MSVVIIDSAVIIFLMQIHISSCIKNLVTMSAANKAEQDSSFPLLEVSMLIFSQKSLSGATSFSAHLSRKFGDIHRRKPVARHLTIVIPLLSDLLTFKVMLL